MNHEELLQKLNEECTKVLELKIQMDQILFDAEERLKAQEAAEKLDIKRCEEVKGYLRCFLMTCFFCLSFFLAWVYCFTTLDR